MTKLQLINGIEEIVNDLKEIEETDFTSCLTFEARQMMDKLFDKFEEEYDMVNDGDCDAYAPETDSLFQSEKVSVIVHD